VFSSLSPVGYFFAVLALAAAVFEVWALVDAVRRPAGAFTAAGKQTKNLWMIILGVAAVVGLGCAFYEQGLAVIGILPVAAFVAAAIYMADVRPKVREFKGNSTSNGPYGPW
jgi:uncharacterized membrane protein YiaA